jgi:hypothetical protein
MKLIIIFLFIPVLSICQPLNNTVKLDDKNLYHDSLLRLLKEFDKELENKTIILEGNPALQIRSDIEGYQILNSEQKLIYWTADYKLDKEVKYLIGEQLIRFVFRPTFIDSGRVHIPVLMSQKIYSNRKKSISSMWEDGQWILIYKYNSYTESFNFESIMKGIML